ESYDFNHISWDPNNYISLLLGGFTRNDAEFLYARLSQLSDIYEKDRERIAGRKIYILTYQGRYYGHVYEEQLDDNPKNRAFIGIRTSLYNQLAHLHGFLNVKQIADYLLDAITEVGKELNYDSVGLVAPIGTMPKIAERRGLVWSNDFSSSPHQIPLSGL